MNRRSAREHDSTEAVSLRRELQSYERAGTSLYLNGRKSRSDAIVHACMCSEDSGYMRDFISDETEHITEIHFIKISMEQV